VVGRKGEPDDEATSWWSVLTDQGSRRFASAPSRNADASC
jgi:hypothetical protein